MEIDQKGLKKTNAEIPSTPNQKHIHKHKNRVFFTNYFDLETAHIGQSHKNGETLEFKRPEGPLNSSLYSCIQSCGVTPIDLEVFGAYRYV